MIGFTLSGGLEEWAGSFTCSLMNLSGLPPEIIGQISQHLLARDIVHLYLTCNSSLARSLEAGVTQFVLASNTKFRIAFFPSSFISRFTYINSIVFNISIEEWVKQVDSTPTPPMHLFPLALEHLETDFILSFDLQFARLLPKTIKILILDRCQVLDQQVDLWELPNLQTMRMSISKWPAKVIPPPTLTSLNLPVLSSIDYRTLVSLPMMVRYLSLMNVSSIDNWPKDSAHFGQPEILLPTALTFLDISKTSGQMLEKFQLPSSLTELYLRRIRPTYFTSFHFELPKLDCLHFDHTIHLNTQFFVKFGVTNLKRLDVTNVRYSTHVEALEFTRLLPAALQALSWMAHPITVDIMEALPRGLTYLRIGVNSTLPPEASTSLPRKLTKLVMRGADSWNGTCLIGMPPDLVSLELKASDDFTDEDMKSLPKNLKALWLSSGTKLTKGVLPLFPKTLKQIFLAGNPHLLGDEPHLSRFMREDPWWKSLD